MTARAKHRGGLSISTTGHQRGSLRQAVPAGAETSLRGRRPARGRQVPIKIEGLSHQRRTPRPGRGAFLGPTDRPKRNVVEGTARNRNRDPSRRWTSPRSPGRTAPPRRKGSETPVGGGSPPRTQYVARGRRARRSVSSSDVKEALGLETLLPLTISLRR